MCVLERSAGDPHGLQPDVPAAEVPGDGGQGHPRLQTVQETGPGQLRHLLQVVAVGDSFEEEGLLTVNCRVYLGDSHQGPDLGEGALTAKVGSPTPALNSLSQLVALTNPCFSTDSPVPARSVR